MVVYGPDKDGGISPVSLARGLSISLFSSSRCPGPGSLPSISNSPHSKHQQRPPRAKRNTVKMPFDFEAYDAKCRGLTPEELQREWQHYTRLISGASTSTAVSGLAIPLTLGVSVIGVGMAAPAIH